jgi:acylphosphatase
MPAFRYLARGRVQGVGFRYFALKIAEELRVTGFVRNLPDGSVEVVAEAGEAVLAEFEAKLRNGPSFGRVEHLDRLPIEERGDTGFQIR